MTDSPGLLLWTIPINLAEFAICDLDLSTGITSAFTAVRNKLWPGESTEAWCSSSGPFNYEVHERSSKHFPKV